VSHSFTSVGHHSIFLIKPKRVMQTNAILTAPAEWAMVSSVRESVVAKSQRSDTTVMSNGRKAGQAICHRSKSFIKAAEKGEILQVKGRKTAAMPVTPTNVRNN
jgi:hypothetical protein